MKEKVYLQITSGRGPAECCRVVALVLERIVKQAQAKGLKVEMIERETGPVNRTLLSATIALQGNYHFHSHGWPLYLSSDWIRTNNSWHLPYSWKSRKYSAA